ncbi:MAG: acyl carrier protein [Candidatus Omnitrophota bacterium]
MKEKVTAIVFAAVEIINQQLSKDEQIDKAMNTPLFYSSGGLDSLGIINLIMTIEQKIQEDLGVNITLANEKALSSQDSPFRTIGNLIDYISLLLNENIK